MPAQAQLKEDTTEVTGIVTEKDGTVATETHDDWKKNDHAVALGEVAKKALSQCKGIDTQASNIVGTLAVSLAEFYTWWKEAHPEKPSRDDLRNKLYELAEYNSASKIDGEDNPLKSTSFEMAVGRAVTRVLELEKSQTENYTRYTGDKVAIGMELNDKGELTAPFDFLQPTFEVKSSEGTKREVPNQDNTHRVISQREQDALATKMGINTRKPRKPRGGTEAKGYDGDDRDVLFHDLFVISKDLFNKGGKKLTVEQMQHAARAVFYLDEVFNRICKDASNGELAEIVALPEDATEGVVDSIRMDIESTFITGFTQAEQDKM